MQAAAIAFDESAIAPLDDADEWRSFSRAAEAPGEWASYIAIEGMWCPACSLAVEDALASCAGVKEVQVNGATATARITWEAGQGKPSDWWRALKRAGYGAVPAGDLLGSARRRGEQRMLLWRWLVAGFCMMQVMMYAAPAYLALPGEMTRDAEALLRWASWLLTLPVVLFSCWPFFRSAWRDVRHARVGMDVPVALGIAVAFAASTAATFDAHSAVRDVWFDSITMFVFFLLSGRMLEQRLRGRTAGALEALARRLPETVERESPAGLFVRVPVRRLKAGDRIRILAGEIVPADGVVVEGSSRVDEALLTGESAPVARGAGSTVVAGSRNMSGTLLVLVTRCAGDTRFAEIVALMEQASRDKPHAALMADRIATPFLLAVIAASAASAAWWWPADPSRAIGVAIAVLIVTCPCALSLATPAAMLASAGALARRGILVRSLNALEACASIDTVVFDKTGTLTRTASTVGAIRTRPGIDAEDAIAWAAALARQSLHPVSRAIAAAGAPATPIVVTDVQETAGIGVSGHVEQGGVLRWMQLGSAQFCDAPRSETDSRAVHLADDAGWIAAFELDEDLRPDARDAVAALRRDRIGVELLSGDHDAASQCVALRAGIPDALGGRTPESKLEHVIALQSSGRRVAMVGDGMNDGPVLACADVSIAMGSGVPLAQARSDFIVSGSELRAVPDLLRHARRTRGIVRENLAWAAAYNAVCVPLAVVGWMPPWLAGLGMAASSLLVVLNSARLARFVEQR